MLISIEKEQSKVTTKRECLKPRGFKLFIKMTPETMKKMEEIQLRLTYCSNNFFKFVALDLNLKIAPRLRFAQA